MAPSSMHYRKKNPYGYTKADFKMANIPKFYKLGSNTRLREEVVAKLKALQAQGMDVDLTSVQQPDALNEAVTEFRAAFPSLFTADPDKAEYITQHFLMTLHTKARHHQPRRKRVAPESETDERAGGRGEGGGAHSQSTGRMADYDNDEDELDQLSVYDRKSPPPDFTHFSDMDSSATLVWPPSANRYDANAISNRMESTQGWGRPTYASQLAEGSSSSSLPNTTTPRDTKMEFQDSTINTTGGTTVSISISSHSGGVGHSAAAGTTVFPQRVVGTTSNFSLYDFLATCQPPLIELLPRFEKRGCNNKYYMRGISTWDAQSRRAWLERIVMDADEEGPGVVIPLLVMVDILDHQFGQYFLPSGV